MVVKKEGKEMVDIRSKIKKWQLKKRQRNGSQKRNTKKW